MNSPDSFLDQQQVQEQLSNKADLVAGKVPTSQLPPSSGGIPGIDDVLALNQSLTADRAINADSHFITTQNLTKGTLETVYGGIDGFTYAKVGVDTTGRPRAILSVNTDSIANTIIIDEDGSHIQGAANLNGSPILTGGLDTVLEKNQSLTADREVDLNGKILKFRHGSNDFVIIDPTTGTENVYVRAINNTDNGNWASLICIADNTKAQTAIISSFNDGGKQSQIIALANVSTASLEHTADRHTFNGKIINPDIVAKNFADDAAAEIGGVELGEDYHTDGVKKVRIV